MISFYLDTSALVKRYVTEKGSPWILGLFAQPNRLITARISHPELASGLARRVREGNLSQSAYTRSLQIFSFYLRIRLWIIEIDNDICDSAAILAYAHALRGYDSVQLACALKANYAIVAARDTPLTFLSSDTRLLNAAAAEGLATDNPELH